MKSYCCLDGRFGGDFRKNDMSHNSKGIKLREIRRSL